MLQKCKELTQMDNKSTSNICVKYSTNIHYQGWHSTFTNQNPDNDGDKDPGGQSTVKSWAAAGALATIAYAYSPPARAGIGDIAKQLTNQFEKMFEPLLSGVFSAFGKIINAGQSDSSSAVVKSQAQSADMIINANREIANQRIELASMPPPNFCESDDLGIASAKIHISSQSTLDRILSESGNMYGNNNTLYLTKISGIPARYSPNGPRPNEHIQLSRKINQNKLEDADAKAFIDGVDVLTAKKMESINLNPAHAASTNKIEQLNYIEQSGKASRLELSKATFLEVLTDRTISANGESKLSLMEKEIARTYGGESSWRNDIANFADPTPVLAELNKQQSFTNYLLLEQLKKTTQQNLLIASQNIELMS